MKNYDFSPWFGAGGAGGAAAPACGACRRGRAREFRRGRARGSPRTYPATLKKKDTSCSLLIPVSDVSTYVFYGERSNQKLKHWWNSDSRYKFIACHNPYIMMAMNDCFLHQTLHVMTFGIYKPDPVKYKINVASFDAFKVHTRK